MKDKKNIPMKNYLILSLVIILTIALLYYIYAWDKTYEKDKLNKSVLENTIQVIKYNELDNYIVEKTTTVIYVSMKGNEKIRRFENKFDSTIKRYDLENDIVYLDITSIMNNKKDKQSALRKYNINGWSIVNIPNVMIFKEGKLEDIYNIKEDNYDQGKLVNYLKENNIIEDNNG